MDKITYKEAGVDTKEGERAVSLMKDHVKKTFNSNVLTGLGGFGGLYALDTKTTPEPILVSGTDGVGTKLKIAFMLDRHDTIGQDCVAMCVNDVLCQGATPLFFLDYIATGGVKAEKIADIVKGVADGCELGGCALIGGETAEMPGFYQEGEYDIAGFSVGVVDRSKLITGQKIKAGDKVIGLPSSGIHSNGYSLVRKLLFDKLEMKIDEPLGDSTVGEVLLTPTRIYTKAISKVLRENSPHGIIHITGGGFYENIPRIMPEGLGVAIDKTAWPRPHVFDFMSNHVEEREMFSTFNMGIGMMIIAGEEELDNAMANVEGEAYLIGEVVEKEGVQI